MSESIEFVLHTKIDGIELTPRTINLSQFNEFNQQVEEFIAGKTGGKLDTVTVSFEEGSHVVKAILSLALLLPVVEDLRHLERQDSLEKVDPKRAEIVKIWQRRAKSHDDTYIELRPSGGAPAIRIAEDTNFREGEKVPWVAIEKYLFGSVENMGGSTAPNVHLRIQGTGKLLLVDSDRDYIKEKPVLYKNVLVRVRAKENAKTGELKDVKLIEFVDYNPQYDEAALDRFAEAGRAAWANIPDGEEWLRELRGG